jgi:transcriptional regulator with XRE-family HTH domain
MVDSHIKEHLIELRKQLGLSQTALAEELGMSLRAYQDIEAGKSAYRRVHFLAVERVALQLAVDRKDIALAPPAVRDDALELAALIRTGRAG